MHMHGTHCPRCAPRGAMHVPACAYVRMRMHMHTHACTSPRGSRLLRALPPSLCCVAAGVRVGVGPTLGLAAFVLALRSLPADAMRSCLFLRALHFCIELLFQALRSCWLLVRDPREPCAACLRLCALPCLLSPTGIELLLLAPSLSLRGLCRPSLALRASSCVVRCICGASILVLLVQQPRGGFPCTHSFVTSGQTAGLLHRVGKRHYNDECVSL